jgi:hypothetical protein
MPKLIDVGREYEVQYWTRAFGVGSWTRASSD